MTKRIMETLLCLVFLIVVVRYGLEQNRVIQREKEVMVLQEKNIGEDVSNPEQSYYTFMVQTAGDGQFLI